MGIPDIPRDKAELLSTLLEAILYGLSLLMFGGTIWAMVFQRTNDQVNCKTLLVACTLLLFSTAHLVIDMIRIMEGLILYRDTFSGGPVGYFSQVSHWTFVCKSYVYTAQTLIGDGVVLYRCYVAWQSKLIMLLPVILWCTVGITGIACPYTASRAKDSRVLSWCLSEWITSFYASTLTTNLVTTLLLAYRIWYINRKVTRLHSHSKSQLRPMLRIILDAGAIYSLTLLSVLICFVTQSNGQYVILNMITPIISIIFYMVNIRVGLAHCANQSTNISPPGVPIIANDPDADEGRMKIHFTRLTEHKIENRRISPMTPRASNIRHGSLAFANIGDAV